MVEQLPSPVDRSSLITSISVAEEKYQSAEEGTDPGQYQPGAKDELLTAINLAKQVRDDSLAAQNQVDQAVIDLNTAVSVFESSKVPQPSNYITNIVGTYSDQIQMLEITAQIDPENIGEVKIDWNDTESDVIWGNGTFSWSRQGVELGDLIKIKAYDFQNAVILETKSFRLDQSGQLVADDEPLDECFIATACFGSKYEPTVVMLRHFRDDYLLSNTLGTKFVNFYYQNSPPIAAEISGSPWQQAVVRVLLTPLIALVYLIYHPIQMGLLILVLSLLFMQRRKQKTNPVC